MNYYDPLLQELEQLDQPNYLTQSGQAMSMRGAPIQVGGGFWSNLAAQLVPGLLGAGMSYLGQQQNAGREADLLEAAKLQDPQAIAAKLEAGGYKGIAAKVLFAAQAAKAEQEAKIADLKNQFTYMTEPTYKLGDAERAADEAYKQAQLGLSRGSQSLQREQIQWEREKLTAKEVLDNQKAEIEAAFKTGQIGRDGQDKINSISSQAMKDPNVLLYLDAKSKLTEMQKLAQEPDAKKRAIASPRFLYDFAKAPGEAFMSDDARRQADALGYGDAYRIMTQKINTGGVIPEDMFLPMVAIQKSIVENLQEQSNQHILKVYAPQVEAVKNQYMSPYAPGKVLVDPSPLYSQVSIQKYPDITSLPGTPKAPTAPTKARSNAGIFSGIASSIYNAIGGR